jgi:hypothetical protein
MYAWDIYKTNNSSSLNNDKIYKKLIAEIEAYYRNHYESGMNKGNFDPAFKEYFLH